MLLKAPLCESFGRVADAGGRRPPLLPGPVPARHGGQAPEVDSVTWLEYPGVSSPGARLPQPGRFVRARCTGRRDYDLVAAPTSVALPVMTA